MTAERKPPGQTPERVSFFTDAIFAIAMTLLVIEIPRPEEMKFSVGHGVSKPRRSTTWPTSWAASGMPSTPTS